MTTAPSSASAAAAEPRSDSVVESNASAAVAQQQQDGDVEAAYHPISDTVKAVHSRIVSNGLVLSALAKVQAIVPTAVSERAVDAATQAQALSIHLAQPLVNSVDNKLNSAIVGVQALPAYGVSKAQQVDQLAFGLTPASLQPHYTAAKELALSTVQRGVAVTGTTVERARAIKAERSQQLWDTLQSLQTQVQTLRSTIEKSGAQATEALHLQARLSELQSKLTQAVSLAQEKREQARHLSAEALTTVSELTNQVTSYLETSVLTPTQRDTVHSLWARLIERVAGLKAQLYGTPSNPPSPASASRSDSAASATEEAAAAAAASASSEAKEGAEAAEAAFTSAAAAASSSEAAATAAAAPAAAATTTTTTTAAAVAEEETDSKTADNGTKRTAAAKHSNAKKHNKKTNQHEEEKQKIAAEAE